MKCGHHREEVLPQTSSQFTHRRGSRLRFPQGECASVNVCEMMTMMSVWLPPETSSMLKVDEAKSDDRYRILMTRLGLEHELRGS